MSFVVAAIIFVVTAVVSLLVAFGNMMSDAPGVNGGNPWPTLVGGTLLALVVASSHWWHFVW